MRRILVLLLLVVLCGAAAATATPLQALIDHYQPPFAASLGRVGGTLWAGQAQVKAPLPAQVAWRWCPRAPFKLVAFCVDLESDEARGGGTVSWSPLFGALQFDDVRLQLAPGPRLAKLASLPLEVAGEMDADVEVLVLDLAARRPTRVEAAGSAKDVDVAGFALGSYVWRMQTDDNGGLSADFRGGRPALEIGGDGQYDPQTGRYRYQAQINTDDRDMRAVLARFANEEKDGALIFSGDGG